MAAHRPSDGRNRRAAAACKQDLLCVCVSRWVRHVLIDNISGLVSGGLVVGTLLGLAIMAVLVVVQVGAMTQCTKGIP